MVMTVIVVGMVVMVMTVDGGSMRVVVMPVTIVVPMVVTLRVVVPVEECRKFTALNSANQKCHAGSGNECTTGDGQPGQNSFRGQCL